MEFSGMLHEHIETLDRYFATLSQMITGEALEKFFHPEIQQTEYPNQISGDVVVRNFTEMLQGADRGKRIFSEQSYDVQKYICEQNDVVAEVVWKGILKIPLSSLKTGDEMVAYFACVFEFKDGLIYRQRNYDCFKKLN